MMLGIERKEIEKYNSVTTLEFIEENEYNPIFPRYVNTSEEQKSIDISSVAKQLGLLEKESKNTNDELTAFVMILKLILLFRKSDCPIFLIEPSERNGQWN